MCIIEVTVGDGVALKRIRLRGGSKVLYSYSF